MQDLTIVEPISPPNDLISLPEGCRWHPRGLELRPGLSFVEWQGIGAQLFKMAGAIMWYLGDWLAYGEQEYAGNKGSKLGTGLGCKNANGSTAYLPHNFYATYAEQYNLTEQTLKNAKCVCAAVNLSRRRDRLTFSHAVEIVGRSKDGQRDFWIFKVEAEGMSTKTLRAQLRLASAKYKPEPNDVGKVTILEISRQYIRDYLARRDKFSPAMKKELAKILAPVLQDLSGEG